jgi:hypothetical protein
MEAFGVAPRFDSKQIANALLLFVDAQYTEAQVGQARGATLRILLTCISLACAAAVLIISHAERQQEAALDALSNYKLKPQPALYTAGISPKPIQAADSAEDD